MAVQTDNFLSKLAIPSFLNPQQTRGLQRLLAVETDGFSMNAAVVHTQNGQVVFESTAQSKLPQFSRALEEVTAQLQHESGDLPHTAILLAPGVLPVLLELPVNPDQPRPDDQMQELLRWEMEPHIAQYVGMWTIEGILLGRGYLSYSQIQDITAEVERRKQAHLPGARFSDIAIERQFITRHQLDECYTLQESMQSMDEDLVCGWSPQATSQFSENGEGFSWLACGVGRTQRQRWNEIFTRRGLALKHIYPIIGCSGASLNGETAQVPSGLVEFRPGFIAWSRINDGRLEELNLHHTGAQPPSPEVLSGVAKGDLQKVWLSGHDPQLPALPNAISTALQTNARPIPVPIETQQVPPGTNPSLFTPIFGACRHALGLPGSNLTVAIPAQDPGPPLWKRVDVWAMATACAIILIIAYLEISMGVTIRDRESSRNQIQENVAKVQSEIDKVNAKLADFSQVEKAIQTTKTELQMINQRRNVLGNLLPQRAAFIPALFDGLSGAVTSGVSIDQVIEQENGEILVNGWALTEKEAQQFAQSLSISMDQWKRKVTNINIWEREGRLNLSGSAFSLRLVQAIPDDERESS